MFRMYEVEGTIVDVGPQQEDVEWGSRSLSREVWGQDEQEALKRFWEGVKFLKDYALKEYGTPPTSWDVKNIHVTLDESIPAEAQPMW